MKRIPIVESVLKLNDEVATINRQTLHEAGVMTINLMGAPGCGKTALIEDTCEVFKDRQNIGIIVGDLTTQRDADRMAQYCGQVVQVNTGKGCHLDANQVRQALTHIDLNAIDLLFIENVGNLICPVGFDLGQDLKVGLFSIAEGDDKAAKHPYLVRESALLLLNKIDLLPHVPFNLDLFKTDVARLNPDVTLMPVSALKHEGIEAWEAWLMQKLNEYKGAAVISSSAN